MISSNLPEWLTEAMLRIEARRPKPEVMDTQEKAEAEGVPLGTSILRYAPPEFPISAQESISDFRAAEILHANPGLWSVFKRRAI